MRKLLAFLLVATAAFTFLTVFSIQQAAAVDLFTNCGTNSAAGTPVACTDAKGQQGNNGTNNPFVNIMKIAINIISFLVGIAAIIGIIIGAFRMIIGGGDTEAQAKARSTVLYSVVGIIVIIVAQSLVVFVLDKIK